MRNLFIFIFVLLSSLSSILKAQNRIDSVLHYSSFLYSGYDKVYDNPSQLHILPMDRDITITYQNKYFNAINSQYYNMYEGDKYIYNTVLAKGYTKNKNGSTVYGFGLFNRNVNCNVKFNTLANYKIFYPYIVGCDKKNDLYTESYSIGGSYAYRFGNMNIGLFASYWGGVYYGISDPRPENKFSDIKICLGTSYDLPNYNIGLHLYYSKYNESIDIAIKKSGLKCYFYSMRGLGLYDYQYSQLSENFSRFITNDKFAFGLSIYEKGMKGLFSNINFSVDKGRNIDANERIPTELNKWCTDMSCGYIFDMDKHIIKVSNDFSLKYAVGAENIYTKYYVHRNPDIIDYNLFVSKKNESIKELSDKLSFTYIYEFDRNNILEINNDNAVNSYKEFYGNKYFADCSYISQSLILGYRFAIRNNYFNTSVFSGYKKNISNKLSIAKDENNILEYFLTNYFEYINQSSKILGLRLQYTTPVYKYISISFGLEYTKNWGVINCDNIGSQIKLIF